MPQTRSSDNAPVLDPKPQVKFDRDKEWRNEHRNVQVTAERYYDAWNRRSDGKKPSKDRWKAGLNCLRQIVMDAEASGKRVRAFGGGWSLSEAAVTRDFLVNTKPLNFVDVGFGAESVVPGLAVDPERLVFAQCGTQVLELNQKLEAKNLSLPTSGASNGQTICGAISTGTHGSAVHVGAMQDYVVSLHVVGGQGNHYWIERESEPVVNEAFCNKLGAKLVRDDRLFNAALVSFGSFGLIHAVLLKGDPIYLLEVHRQRFDWSQVEGTIGTLDVSGLGLPGGDELPFHFEVILNPYATAAGKKGAVVVAMYKRDYVPQPSPPGPGGATEPGVVTTVPGVGLLGFIGTLTDVAPGLIPPVINKFVEDIFPPVSGRVGTHGQTFGGTKIRGKALSTEIGVQLWDTPKAVNAILEVASLHSFVGVIALRYVRGSAALLAFTKFDVTCTIELPGVGSHRTIDFFERVWQKLEDNRIPHTLHWGQSNHLTEVRVRNMWGSAVDDWLAARRGFLSVAGRRTFSNDFLVRCGLAE